MTRFWRFGVFVGAIVALAALAAPATAAAPSATTGAATSVTSTSATLTGEVNPNGEPTTYHFEYGTTNAYGARTPDQGPTAAVKQNTDVSAPVSGLSPGTTYHYRLVAANGSGTKLGADKRFTTPSNLSFGASPARLVFGRTVLLSGVLSGPEIAAVEVRLEANPYPFAGFKRVAQTTTDAGGRYAFNQAPGVNTMYRAVASTKPATQSADVTVPVQPRISLGIRRAGGSRRFAGSVAPAHTGATIRIQRRVGRRWRTVKRAVLAATSDPARSRYATRIRRPRSGLYRAYLPADADHAAGVSARRRIR
jgi:Fibronectin type III domain